MYHNSIRKYIVTCNR